MLLSDTGLKLLFSNWGESELWHVAHQHYTHNSLASLCQPCKGGAELVLYRTCGEASALHAVPAPEQHVPRERTKGGLQAILFILESGRACEQG